MMGLRVWRWLPLLLVIAAAFVGRERPALGADELVVFAGNGEGGYAVNAFLPAAVAVREGTTIRWDFAWYEPHTVTFGSPTSVPIVSTPSPAVYDGSAFVTSDMTFGPGRSYAIQFPRAGTYLYSCLIHPYHKGSVVVVAADSNQADTLATASARAATEYATAVAELKAIAADARAQPLETRTLSDGSTERLVRIARETQFGDVQQYFPPLITLDEGDTITWRSAARTPHTVTFGPFPAGVPLPGNPLVDAVARPGETYEGSGYWNSGVLGIDWPLGTEFSLKFTKAGTYAYFCILHENQGHRGTVEVVAKATPPASTPSPKMPGVPPAAPVTGTGIRDSGAGGHDTWWLGAGALLVLAAFGAVAAARRS